ncbi:MAG TPA: TerC family protein [Chthonomonadaceae bacterium]|nr:TerC family protein [Chthonomonadaceae bacterium]
MTHTILWIAFAVTILFFLALDLGVLHRQAHTVTLREAGLWSALWAGLAMAFAGGVFLFRGHTAGLQFLTGYVIELSLSVDNVFLFAVIFTYFQVPARYQHRVLSWGVFSAVVMRGIMIAAGAALFRQFAWIIYVFGAFLILTGIKLFLRRNERADISKNPLIRWLQRALPFTERYDGQKFFTQIDGVRYSTPLLLVLTLVESTDLLFALDSIPAVFAVTRDPFIVFTSNIFAILGLRSLYFLLAGIMGLFRYLSVGLSAILVFVGVKMLASAWGLHIPIEVSLPVIAGILALSIGASLLTAHRERSRALPKPIGQR